MRIFLKKFCNFSKEITPKLNSFFNGKLYPFIIAALVLIGHISGAEFWLNIFIVLSTCLALLISESIKPFLPLLFLIIYQVNIKHTPDLPIYSDYYFSGFRLIILIILATMLLLSLIYYAAKHVVLKISFKNSPLLIPILILCASFILNGLFSNAWSLETFVYGLGQVVIFFLLFYLLYHGLEKDRASELTEYFSYISLLIAMVLIGEVAFVYLTYDNLFNEEGAIIRESILFGWGVQNSMGFMLAVTIPSLMRGAMKNKYYIVYLSAAFLAWAAAFLTFSRNAWLFSTAAIAISLIIACFFSNKKKFYRILTVSGIFIGAIGIFAFWSKISPLFAKLAEVGFSDNGRFALWKNGINYFLQNPIFGIGFFGFGAEEWVYTPDFIPTMAHNTLVQLLSTTGLFGLLSYIYYRVKTIVPLIKKPNFEKTMLFLTIAVTLGASLLDNFIFSFHTAFPYILALVIIFKIQAENEKQL